MAWFDQPNQTWNEWNSSVATAAFLASPLVYCGGDAFPSYRAFHTKKLPSASCP
jgi:hypothetical protein